MNKVLVLLFFALVACAKSSSPNNPHEHGGDGENGPVGAKPGCELNFAKSGDCASFVWITEPTERTPGTFEIRFADASGPYPLNADLLVSVAMKGMNHPAPKIKIENVEKKSFVFRVSNVYLSMRGQWMIKIRLQGLGTVLDEVTYVYNL